MDTKIDNWNSEYELREFIDTAMRWQIEAVYNGQTENNPFGTFDYDVKIARENFEKFRTQLNQKISASNNWKAIEIDLKHRFLPMLNIYLQWYEANKQELKKFRPYCPYTSMFSVIESTKAEILKYFPKIDISNNISNTIEIQNTKLKVNQIALIHVYKQIQITRENAREIAMENGYTSITSGEGLFQDYTYYCSSANRKGKPTNSTSKKLKNKIELFESILKYLSDEAKSRANDDIKILKTIYENEY